MTAQPSPLHLPLELEPAEPPPALLGRHVRSCRSVSSDLPKALCPRPGSRDWAELPRPPHPSATPGPWWSYLVVLLRGQAGLLGQRWLLGGPASEDSAGLGRLLLAGCPHHPSQHIVLLPQLPETHTLRLQGLLQLQDSDLQPHTSLSRPGASPQGALPPLELSPSRDRHGGHRAPRGPGGSVAGVGTYLGLHFLLLQLNEGQAREVHGVCSQRGGKCLGACPTPQPRPGPRHSPLSSICSWPDFVEATTLAAISLTVREHSCRRLRLGLCLSAFTWGSVGESQGGLGSPPSLGPPATRSVSTTARS